MDLGHGDADVPREKKGFGECVWNLGMGMGFGDVLGSGENAPWFWGPECP